MQRKFSKAELSDALQSQNNGTTEKKTTRRIETNEKKSSVGYLTRHTVICVWAVGTDLVGDFVDTGFWCIEIVGEESRLCEWRIGVSRFADDASLCKKSTEHGHTRTKPKEEQATKMIRQKKQEQKESCFGPKKAHIYKKSRFF